MRELVLNKGRAFTVTDVKVMPESLPAAFSRLAELKPGPAETTLIIDLGGTTLDAGVIVGQFDDISAVHGNPSVGVSQVTAQLQARCVRQTAKPAPSSLTLSSATAMIVSICSV